MNNNNNLYQNYNNSFNNQISPTPPLQNTPPTPIPTNNNYEPYQQPMPQPQNTYLTNTPPTQNNPLPQNQIPNNINQISQNINNQPSTNLAATPLTDLNIDGTYNKLNKEIPTQEVNHQTKKNTITLTKENKVFIIIFIVMLLFLLILPYIFDLTRKIKY